MFSTYWGKTDFPGQFATRRAHLLAYHCLDVAAAGDVFLRKDFLLKQRLTAVLGEDVVAALPFLLALHDVGKFSYRFQGLVPELCPAHLSGVDIPPYTRDTHHTRLAWWLWQGELAAAFEKGMATGAPTQKRPLDALLQAVYGHHGRPVSYDGLVRPFHASDVQAAIDFAAEVARLLPGSARLADITKSDAKRLKQGSHLLAGFVVLCDWIGSDERHFPFVGEFAGLEDYWTRHALPRAEKAVAASGALAPAARKVSGFSELFPKIKAPSPLQRFAEELAVEAEPTLLILEDLTGSGKTEAALMAAHRMREAAGGGSLFVALPTMATANAMYERVADGYSRLFVEGSRPSLVLAHSARRLHKGFEHSIGLEFTPSGRSAAESEESAQAQCAAWLGDSSRKAFLAAAGVGTVDQALLAVLPSKFQALRLLGLSRGVLVVDEVHAYDPYVHRLLRALLEFHAAMGGSAVLLSATLPLRTRRELMAAFRRGLGAGAPEPENVRYPLATRVSARDATETPLDIREGTRRSVRFELVGDERKMARAAALAARTGACVAWVRNTVDDAVRAWELLRAELGPERVGLFHARFAMGDRLDIEAEALRRFGKDSTPEDRAGRVLVATQVIEQSLDIDVDLLLSDLCPIDLLLQRAGRCQRHERGYRPDGYGSPRCLVLSPEPADGAGADWFKAMFSGGAAVYPSHGRLWRTARMLAETPVVTLPEDARRLVEGVYGDGEAGFPGLEPPEALASIDRKAEGEGLGKRDMAAFNALPLHLGYTATFTHWVDDIVAPTRLGEETVTLRLARYENGAIRPWRDADTPARAWALSEVRVRRNLITDAAPPADKAERLAREAALAGMPDKGKYAVLCPLYREGTDEFTWRGSGLRAGGDAIDIRYVATFGLSIPSPDKTTR